MFNSTTGTNIGALFTPLIVPWIAVHLGWRWAYPPLDLRSRLLPVDSFGSALRTPQQHPHAPRANYNTSKGDSEPPSGKIKWTQLLLTAVAWAIAGGSSMIDPAGG